MVSSASNLRPPPPRVVLEDLSGDEESRPVSLLLSDSEDDLEQGQTWPGGNKLEPRPSILRPWSTPDLPGHRHDVSRALTARQQLRVRHRSGSRKPRKRVVFKNGDCNVLQTNISKRRLRYLQDIFTTLVDVQWRWTLLVFALSFVLSWLGFAVIWWLIAFSHGDLEPNHLPDSQEESNWTPCVVNIFNFASCFLFSVETQHTIGYGSRSTTEECPEAIFIMCLQSITGVMIQAFMVGIVFAKMSRPKKRTQTLLFSRSAVICQRDGQLCLMFRVGDMRKSHIIGAGIRAQLIRSRQTKEGELLAMYQHELVVGADSDQSDIFFIWPTNIVHKIDASSPLYHMSAADMIRERFEIVVILEGCIESTGQTTQARSSYLPSEILWGHRFQPLVSFSKDRGGYEVDYSLFNNTYEVETPLCSARDLEHFNRIQDEIRHSAEISVRDMANSLVPFGGGLRRVTSEPGGQVGQQGALQHAGVPLLALDQTPESPD
ncbi:G protein-activated inward rectifier potassium channel 3 isoform X2 [Neocloeon triangulifer]|uniref:G protein-activated inward rectifier potassium channel 3 isoform X2 n=1 Tax=Neocloeon triangulifer TaxID=2078957 RepID=UPI00286ED0DF|nr:G protein-activated inward rectifier potassium channel 3 isoform X2 [Neocloeon triangulifer]